MTEPSPTDLSTSASAWYDAIAPRRSRRAFLEQTASSEDLDALERVCLGFRPYADARVELVRTPGTDVFRGAIGNYGRVTGAPHFVAVIADTGSAHSQWHAGYTGEAVVLEATALGLDTCWVGGFFRPDRVRALVELEGAERVVAVSPIGHAVDGATGTERAMRAMASSSRRRPLAEIAPDLDDEWPAWARAGVKAARLAPSAVNRQPWRFRLEEGALVVSKDRPGELPKVTKALDCGIAMLHAELGALHEGMSGTWHDLGVGLDVGRFAPERGGDR